MPKKMTVRNWCGKLNKSSGFPILNLASFGRLSPFPALRRWGCPAWPDSVFRPGSYGRPSRADLETLYWRFK